MNPLTYLYFYSIAIRSHLKIKEKSDMSSGSQSVERQWYRTLKGFRILLGDVVSIRYVFVNQVQCDESD